MSDFSERLKLLVEASGVSIYQLSKNARLDRTTIQRTLSGERLPGIAFVEKLCEYLRVSPSEEKEVFELYNICKVGDKVYQGRKYIKEIIERIASIYNHGINIFNINKGITSAAHIDEDSLVFTGQYITNNMLREVIEDEVSANSSPRINVSVPFSCSFLFDLLYQLYLTNNGKIEIKNIIRLNKNPYASQNPNYNLEILAHVMPFAFSAGNEYQPYYYYDNFDVTKDISLLMPFYIITSKRLITLSPDFKTAILYNNECIIDVYKESFNSAISLTKPFITQHVNCDDMLRSYLEMFNDFGNITHIIEPQPCFAWYYSDELINKKLRPEVENREMILSLLYKFYGRYRDTKDRFVSIFSIEGMKHFVTTGVLADLPTQFALPFTPEERLTLLKALRDDLANGNYPVFAANPSNFTIPISSIQLHGTNALSLYSVDANGIISSSRIEEKSIAEAFYDFFESLPGSDLIYGKDETLNIIDDFISRLLSIM